MSLDWQDMKMDVKNMSDFESGSFDAVIDKGTIIIAVLDSIMEATANADTCTWILDMASLSNPFYYLQEH